MFAKVNIILIPHKFITVHIDIFPFLDDFPPKEESEERVALHVLVHLSNRWKDTTFSLSPISSFKFLCSLHHHALARAIF